jgi:hypothetical protein
MGRRALDAIVAWIDHNELEPAGQTVAFDSLVGRLQDTEYPKDGEARGA